MRVTGGKPSDHLQHRRLELRFVTPHQHRVLQRILGQQPDFRQVLGEHFQFFGSGNHAPLARKPGVLARSVTHVGHLS